MSTSLKSISAKIEIPNTDTNTSKYIETEVLLTSFWGGKKRGPSLQITFLNEEKQYSHIQLDYTNIKALKEILDEL